MTEFEVQILQKLDIIIKELRKKERVESLTVNILERAVKEIYDSLEYPTPQCTCHFFKSGESSTGWYCPIHGQMF